LAEHLTVRLVAIFQTTIRDFVCEVVNCNDRCELPLPIIKETITLQMVREFKNKKITIGEFVAHLMPVSSFAQICYTVDEIAGKSLMDILYDMIIRTSSKGHLSALAAKGLKGLFHKRNIICHEAHSGEPIKMSDIALWFQTVVGCTAALGKHVDNLINAAGSQPKKT